MAYRSLVWVLLALGIAVSCSGDPSKKVVRAEDAGAGGEAGEGDNGSGGSMLTPQAGAPGAGMPGTGTEAGAGGEATTPVEMGGAGGEPSMTSASGAGGQDPGGEGGAAGETSLSECGTGQYLAYEIGCQECPALPNPNDPTPTAMDCEDWESAYWDGEGKLLDLQFSTSIHEAFGGKVSVSWSDGQAASGSGQYDWSFDGYNSILIEIPDAPVNASSFNVTYLAFEDACGFLFYAQSINVYQDSTWHCGTPPEPQISECGEGKYESGIDGCFTCPALPEPNTPIQVACETANNVDFDGYFIDLGFQNPGIHEAFEGIAHIGWKGPDDVFHEGDFPWEYDEGTRSFAFYVDNAIPNDVEVFSIYSITFTDACGFVFTTDPLITAYYDNEGGYYLGGCGT